MLLGDVHYDNTKCDRRKLGRVLDEAVRIDAPILDIGDFLDLMQGKTDRRADKAALRPEYLYRRRQYEDRTGKVLPYLDAVIDDTVEQIGRYAGQFAVIAEGNHESAPKRYNETDVSRRLCESLAATTGNVWPMAGGYSNYVNLRFVETSGTGRTQALARSVYMYHGSSGNSPVTHGVIGANRRSTWLADADVIVTGHLHKPWTLPTVKERFDRGRVSRREQLHIQVGSFKDEHGTGEGGWATEKGFAPAPVGAAYWLIATYDAADQEIKLRALRC